MAIKIPETDNYFQYESCGAGELESSALSSLHRGCRKWCRTWCSPEFSFNLEMKTIHPNHHTSGLVISRNVHLPGMIPLQVQKMQLHPTFSCNVMLYITWIESCIKTKINPIPTPPQLYTGSLILYLRHQYTLNVFHYEQHLPYHHFSYSCAGKFCTMLIISVQIIKVSLELFILQIIIRFFTCFTSFHEEQFLQYQYQCVYK